MAGGQIPGSWMGTGVRPVVAARRSPLIALRHGPSPTSNQPRRMCGRSRNMSSYSDQELQDLLARAKAQGYLTYEEVSQYLPDETVGTDRIDEVLTALDQMGIELVDGP